MNFNLILTAPNNEQKLRDKAYNKTIFVDIHVESDRWYYFSKTGKLRVVYAGYIWTNQKDADGYNTGYMKKIRKIESQDFPDSQPR